MIYLSASTHLPSVCCEEIRKHRAFWPLVFTLGAQRHLLGAPINYSLVPIGLKSLDYSYCRFTIYDSGVTCFHNNPQIRDKPFSMQMYNECMLYPTIYISGANHEFKSNIDLITEFTAAIYNISLSLSLCRDDLYHKLNLMNYCYS